MAILFPVSIDDLADVSTGDTITAGHKNDLNDLCKAIEDKLGADSSAVATSHDYLLTHLPAQAGDFDAGAVEVRAQTFESDIVTGTAPLTIASTTVVTNLNADTVDGKHVAGTNGAGEITTNDGTQTLTNKTLTSPTLTTPTLGVATATSVNGLTIDTTTGTLDITNAKTLTVTGDVTISATPYTPGGTDVAIADGGTGAGTAQAAINALAGGVTANKVLRGNGSNILLAAVNMATDVTGTLPVGNGGTGVTAAANGAGGVVIPAGAVNAASGAVVLDASSKISVPQLGAWVDKSASYAAQQAATDGFVVVVVTTAGSDGVHVYTDANADPTTKRGLVLGKTVTISGSAMVPVKKNDYWKIVKDASAVIAAVYWIPIGS